MNRTIVIGNLVRNPESRQVGDKTVCNFTLACNRRKKIEGQPEADFFRVSAWGKLGENCQKWLVKGKKAAVTGPVSVHVYTKQDGTPGANLELLADDVEFLSPAGEGGGNAQGTAPAEQDMPVNMTPVDMDGELPF